MNRRFLEQGTAENHRLAIDNQELPAQNHTLTKITFVFMV
jgi:hypothetical protein